MMQLNFAKHKKSWLHESTLDFIHPCSLVHPYPPFALSKMPKNSDSAKQTSVITH
ncbi:hypothetical protein Hanom_Chr15g01351791 [Helianthus anomalus]